MHPYAISIMIGFLICAGACESTASPAGSRVRATAATQPGASFERARDAFRAHAAKTLKLRLAEVLVSPMYADANVQPPERLGAAWAFYGLSRAQPSKETRGWALADGTVITLDRNLGLLLQEAGVWTRQRTLTASQIAELLVWSLGMNHLLEGRCDLEVAPDGSGVFSFRDAYHPPGPSPGPNRITQFTITLTADHRAQLVKREVPPPTQELIE